MTWMPGWRTLTRARATRNALTPRDDGPVRRYAEDGDDGDSDVAGAPVREDRWTPASCSTRLPVVGVFVLFAVVALATYEVGYRVGLWWQARTPDEKEGPTAMLVGSLLALMAFLLAVTMGMASDRFDTRRQLVLEEANAIGTVYLRAGYLPQPASDQTRQLLREYVPLRINTADRAELDAQFARSAQIQGQLWAIVEPLARSSPDSQVLAIYIGSQGQAVVVDTRPLLMAAT